MMETVDCTASLHYLKALAGLAALAGCLAGLLVGVALGRMTVRP